MKSTRIMTLRAAQAGLRKHQISRNLIDLILKKTSLKKFLNMLMKISSSQSSSLMMFLKTHMEMSFKMSEKSTLPFQGVEEDRRSMNLNGEQGEEGVVLRRITRIRHQGKRILCLLKKRNQKIINRYQKLHNSRTFKQIKTQSHYSVAKFPSLVLLSLSFVSKETQ